MPIKKNLTILGSTGSIGENVLDVISSHQGGFNVVALSAKTQLKKLLSQCLKFKPKYALLGDKKLIPKFLKSLQENNVTDIAVLDTSKESYKQIITDSDKIVLATSTTHGILPAILTIEQGKELLLANKECLVIAGNLLIALQNKYNNKIIPIDSEHAAIAQCLLGLKPHDVKKIILTASGGPFLGYSLKELKNVTVEQALKHPNWSMGQKITIDSSTMMNKGLELIEAYYLFSDYSKEYDVIIHPQSIVHSMVELIDNSILAQLSVADMRIPISAALNYPEHLTNNSKALNLTLLNGLTFKEVDYDTMPCLKLALEALHGGDNLGLILNTANTIAVDLFLAKKIKYLEIAKLIAKAMNKFNTYPLINNFEDLLALEKELTIKILEEYS